MRHIVLGTVAAVALAASASTASAQHGGHSGGHGFPVYTSGHGGHGFTGHSTFGHARPGGHVVHPGGGFYAGPSYGGVGIGGFTGPTYVPSYPAVPVFGHGRGHVLPLHHGRHH